MVDNKFRYDVLCCAICAVISRYIGLCIFLLEMRGAYSPYNVMRRNAMLISTDVCISLFRHGRAQNVRPEAGSDLMLCFRAGTL